MLPLILFKVAIVLFWVLPIIGYVHSKESGAFKGIVLAMGYWAVTLMLWVSYKVFTT